MAIVGEHAKLLASTILGAPLGALCTRVSIKAASGEHIYGFAIGDTLTFDLDMGHPAYAGRTFVVIA